MKSIITAVIAIVLMSCKPAHASDFNKFCIGQSELAEKVMSGRQNGVPMHKMLGTLDNITDENFKGIMEYMIELAYDVPRYSTEQYKNHAKVEFGNKFYKLCSSAANKNR